VEEYLFNPNHALSEDVWGKNKNLWIKMKYFSLQGKMEGSLVAKSKNLFSKLS